jgi:hypothetical protein
MTLAFSILLEYYTYLDICYISFTLLILALRLILFYNTFSYLISSFSSLISVISGLIALYIIAFISSILDILDILDILPICIAGITLGNDLVVEENTELPELARNSYIFSLSSSVFCRFCGIIDCSEAFISIKGDLDFYLFYLFCFFVILFALELAWLVVTLIRRYLALIIYSG